MAKQSYPVLTLSFTALGAVSAGRAVGFNGAQATAAGQKIMGVSPRDVATGRMSDLHAVGTTVIELGGTVTVGASLVSDTQGRAVVAAGTPGEFIFADALEAGGIGNFVEVLLRR